MTTPMFPEYPAAATPHKETPPKQELSETMMQITDVFGQIQALCKENETAKNLFESADNWGMPLESRLRFLQGVLEDDRRELPFKNILATKMLTSLQTVLATLREQTARGHRAQVNPIKKAREALDQLFHTEVQP